jgi:exopolysaccharide production protein ExoY
MSSIPVYPSGYSRESEWAWQLIGACERIAAALLLVFLTPLVGVIWIAILVLSGRSPLIAHRRVGQHGSELWVLKFRTMWGGRASQGIRRALSVDHIDDEAGPAQKGPRDLRVASRFGRFCRQHSLDELPQLAHVVLGQMSLVGPRPVTPAELQLIYGPNMAEILPAKPGLSGLWQVSGRSRLSAAERCSLDLECVRRRSMRLYFWILMRTVPEVFIGGGAW